MVIPLLCVALSYHILLARAVQHTAWDTPQKDETRRMSLAETRPYSFALREVRASSVSLQAYFLDDERAVCNALTGSGKTQVAVAFYGLIRNIANTIDGLERNLLNELRKFATVNVFAHSMRSDLAYNAHTPDEMQVTLPPQDVDVLRLKPCVYALVDQRAFDQSFNVDNMVNMTMQRSRNILHPFNDVGTMRNIFRSRYSLYSVGQLIVEYETQHNVRYDYVVAARPDTTLLSPLPWRPIPGGGVRVPNYSQGSGDGVDDRFAYGDHDSMLHVYMHQFDEQLSTPVAMVDSENLLCQHLGSSSMTVGVIPVCVVRIRATGVSVAQEYVIERSRPICPGIRAAHELRDDLANTCPPVPADAERPGNPAAKLASQ